MNEPQFTSQEKQLIDQLRRSPSLEMSQESAEKLRQRLFAEADFIYGDAPLDLPVQRKRAIPVGLLVALLILIAGLMVFAVLSNLPDETPIEEEILSTPTVIEETITPSLTSTLTASAAPTTTPTLMPTSTMTLIPTSTAPPPATAEDTSLDDDDVSPQALQIVIEGSVQAVGENYITIFDIHVETHEARPNLAQISIGTLVRVEGESRFENGQIIIRATQITILSSPGAGQSAQPQGQQPAPQPPPPAGGFDSRSSRSS